MYLNNFILCVLMLREKVLVMNTLYNHLQTARHSAVLVRCDCTQLANDSWLAPADLLCPIKAEPCVDNQQGSVQREKSLVFLIRAKKG